MQTFSRSQYLGTTITLADDESKADEEQHGVSLIKYAARYLLLHCGRRHNRRDH
jgi:hypothetical protein